MPAALLAEQRRTQRIFEVVMVALASISLLVGGIGIMNIMLASVPERTREIGVRRALGARRTDIVRQFLIETVLISFVGGTIGVIAGVGISRLIGFFAGWSTIVTASSILLAFVVSVSSVSSSACTRHDAPRGWIQSKHSGTNSVPTRQSNQGRSGLIF